MGVGLVEMGRRGVEGRVKDQVLVRFGVGKSPVLCG